MDEPCSALDPISTAKIEELMVELKNLTTIVIVTTNMQQAARVSDFTAFLLTGQIIEFSPTPHLFTTPAIHGRKRISPGVWMRPGNFLGAAASKNCRLETGRVFMERHFEKDLNELKERLLWMGSLAERAVHQSVHAVLESDEQLANAFWTKKMPSTSCNWK